MNNALQRMFLWFWYLVPCNPILVRVVLAGSRRSRHLWLRAGYLAALIVVVSFSLTTAMSGQSGSLTDLAKGASNTFKFASITQLALMCFLAPIFAAGAITQERDAQTYNILISTPLTNGQIVFGSLLSRLYFVIILLVAGLPIFLMTMVYGGVTARQVFESFALAGATAVITGALAITVSVISVGTQRTIFSFYLVIAIYLVGIYLLGLWPNTWMAESDAIIAGGRRMSWLTPVHPFLALDVALNEVQAPPYGRLGSYSALTRYALAYPSAFYVTWTMLVALALTTFSVLFARRGIKSGEETFFSRLAARISRREVGQRTRAPRSVWSNPVAWREAKTRGAAGGWFRWVIVAAGTAGSLFIFFWLITGSMAPGTARQTLSALILVQVAIALIFAANVAATSMTKEREAQTMDILLTTVLTSKYILWGKLRGLVSFCIPLIGGPVVILLLFGIYGLFSASPPVVWIETPFVVAILAVGYTAATCVIGLIISLNNRKTVTAIMYSVGSLILAAGIATGIVMAFIKGIGGAGGGFFAPFSPATGTLFVVNQEALFDSPQEFVAGATTARVAVGIGTVVAVLALLAIVSHQYGRLVRDFDMTMRKQSAGK